VTDVVGNWVGGGDRAGVGADNAVTSCDLRILVDEAAEPVASSEADGVVRGRHGDLSVRRLLAKGPVRPVGVVVINVFAEDLVKMSLAGDEDAVGALAPDAGDPPLADRVRPRRLNGCCDDPVPLGNRILVLTWAFSVFRRLARTR
jgi:hypothetical protein